jgi:UDP-N-acetylmuramate dehydrogenase
MHDALGPPDLQENVPLAPLTTFRIGGPARYFRRAVTVDEIEAMLCWARRRAVPLFILGGGSNVVISDAGFDGLVLQAAPRGLELASDGHSMLVRIAAGEIWSDVVSACVARNLAGVECLAGIPGLAGGVPIQNVGAYGQEIADTLESVEAIDRHNGRRVRFRAAQCGFAYRRSRFNGDDAGRFVVTRITLRLRKNGPPVLTYPAVRDAVLAAAGPDPALRQVAAAVVAIRRAKAMVLDDDDFCSHSAGSFFLNPIVQTPELARARAQARLHGVDVERMPATSAGASQWKLSSAWMIEQSGFPKGFRMGNVAVSPKHPLALVNTGGGTAREVVRLARTIRRGVLKTFGVQLHPEPVFAGFSAHPLCEGADA